VTTAIFAHFDPHGLVAQHVVDHLDALVEVAERVIVVSTARLVGTERAKLASRATVITRPNEGYDFASWAHVLRPMADTETSETVILANDSVIGPLTPYSDVFEDVKRRNGGALPPVLGPVRSDELAPHLQSFFFRFDAQVVRTSAFRAFWLSFEARSDRRAVIEQCELGLSRVLMAAGYELAAVFEPTDAERTRSAYLQASRGRLRTQAEEEQFVDDYRQRTPPPSNLMIGLWDCALDGRLPWVKFETLRDDPYRIGSDLMLEALRHRWPQRFDGVADHMDRTSEALAILRNVRPQTTP